MEAQHCFYRADADTPLKAQALTLVGTLKIVAAGWQQVRRASRILCYRLRDEHCKDQNR